MREKSSEKLNGEKLNGEKPDREKRNPEKADVEKQDIPGTKSSQPTTARLMKMLETSPGSFLRRHLAAGQKDKVFHEYLYELMNPRGVHPADLISGACISKTYAYQFLNGERLPGRDIVLRIAFFLRLDIEETQRLLTLSGNSILYPRIHRDSAILFCLQKKMALDETNFFLDDCGEETLL